MTAVPQTSIALGGFAQWSPVPTMDKRGPRSHTTSNTKY